MEKKVKMSIEQRNFLNKLCFYGRNYGATLQFRKGIKNSIYE